MENGIVWLTWLLSMLRMPKTSQIISPAGKVGESNILWSYCHNHGKLSKYHGIYQSSWNVVYSWFGPKQVKCCRRFVRFSNFSLLFMCNVWNSIGIVRLVSVRMFDEQIHREPHIECTHLHRIFYAKWHRMFSAFADFISTCVRCISVVHLVFQRFCDIFSNALWFSIHWFE